MPVNEPGGAATGGRGAFVQDAAWPPSGAPRPGRSPAPTPGTRPVSRADGNPIRPGPAPGAWHAPRKAW